MNRHAHLIGVVLVAIAIAVFPLVDGNAFHLKVLFMIAVNYLAAAGLNVLVGHTGQKSLGHAGLFAVGAYTVALLTTRGEWNPWLAFVASGFAAALFGVVIALPALRVKGPALAMVTIGFGIVVEKVDPGALAVATPEGVELHVNLQVAKRLGLPESFANEVLVFAARQGLAVKAVE